MIDSRTIRLRVLNGGGGVKKESSVELVLVCSMVSKSGAIYTLDNIPYIGYFG